MYLQKNKNQILLQIIGILDLVVAKEVLMILLKDGMSNDNK